MQSRFCFVQMKYMQEIAYHWCSYLHLISYHYNGPGSVGLLHAVCTMWKRKLLQGCKGTYCSVVSVYILCNILYCVVKRYATGLNVGTSHHAWHVMRTCHCKPKLHPFFATLCHTQLCHCMSCHDTSCHQNGVKCAAAPTFQDRISIFCTWLAILILERGVSQGCGVSRTTFRCIHHATSTTSLC